MERNCITCSSAELETLSTGRFVDPPLRDFIAGDPYGERPEPYIAGAVWKYVRCRACGTTFHQRVLSPEWTERLFDKWMTAEAIAQFEGRSQSPDKLFGKGQGNVGHILNAEVLTRQLRKDKPVRLLDVGCGNGDFLMAAKAFGIEAVGVDRSAARKKMNPFSIYCDLDELNSAQLEPFHVVVLFEVLEHLHDPLSMLKRVRRFITDQGVLIVTTPDCSGVRNITTLHDYRMINPLSHINGFVQETLILVASKAGFTNIPPPTPFVSAEWSRVLKRAARLILSPILKASTQQYFRAV
jgi:SAM-dependent methyltransferase